MGSLRSCERECDGVGKKGEKRRDTHALKGVEALSMGLAMLCAMLSLMAILY